MEFVIGGFWEQWDARVGGPGRFRFIIQPLVAVALGVRDGIADAKAGRPPYMIGVCFYPEQRRQLLQSAVEDAGKPFAVGVVLDMILQWFIFRSVRLIPAIIAGALLIGLPYSLSRGVTNRIICRLNTRSGNRDPETQQDG